MSEREAYDLATIIEHFSKGGVDSFRVPPAILGLALALKEITGAAVEEVEAAEARARGTKQRLAMQSWAAEAKEKR
jgi:hypothetical protein